MGMFKFLWGISHIVYIDTNLFFYFIFINKFLKPLRCSTIQKYLSFAEIVS